MSAGDSYGGIEVPQGDPDALRGAANQVRGSAGMLEAASAQLESMLGGLGWRGPASIAHAGLTSTQAGMARVGVAALEGQATVISDYAETLEAAQRRADQAIEDARDADRRIRIAEREIEQAEADQRSAQTRIETARAAKAAADNRVAAGIIDVLAADAGAAAEASAAAEREIADAQRDLEDAQRRERRARRDLEQAREDRREAQRRGQEAAESVEIARHGLVAAAQSVGFLPTQPGGPGNPAFATAAGIALPPPPPPPKPAEEDRPWYEDAAGGIASVASWTWDQAKQVPGGAVEGVTGIYEGGKFLYEAAPTPQNLLFERDRLQERWSQLGDAGEFAWNNPGEFGKQLINYEDLAAGRYGEWLGNLAPDAVLAVTTAGAGTAASRGLRATDAVADTAQAARHVDPPPSPRPEIGPITREQHLADLYAQADAHGIPRPYEGMPIQRTYGEMPQPEGILRGSGPYGASWSPAPLDSVANPRDAFGLPHFNGGRYVVEGTLTDPAAIREIRPALPWPPDRFTEVPEGYHQRGGAPEYLIPDSDRHVHVDRVSGVNPDF